MRTERFRWDRCAGNQERQRIKHFYFLVDPRKFTAELCFSQSFGRRFFVATSARSHFARNSVSYQRPASNPNTNIYTETQTLCLCLHFDAFFVASRKNTCFSHKRFAMALVQACLVSSLSDATSAVMSSTETAPHLVISISHPGSEARLRSVFAQPCFGQRMNDERVRSGSRRCATIMRVVTTTKRANQYETQAVLKVYFT